MYKIHENLEVCLKHIKIEKYGFFSKIDKQFIKICIFI